MMKYFSAALLIIISCANGCNNEASIKKRFKTKDKYRCSLKLDKEEYFNDSILFIKKFQSYMRAKKGPYNAPAYDDRVVVYVDTIIYDTHKNLAALFIIARCFEERPSNNSNYNGITHFANRVKDTVTNKYHWEVYANHGTRHILAETYEKMSNILRQNNLILRSYQASKNHEIGYNLDDCRFWTSDEFRKEIQAGGFVTIP